MSTMTLKQQPAPAMTTRDQLKPKEQGNHGNR